MSGVNFAKLTPQLFGPFKTEGGGHKRPQDVEFWMGWQPERQVQTWAGVQPSTYKMLDPNRDAYQLALAKMPNTLIVLRSWSFDDNNGQRWGELMANPAQAGADIVDRWIALADTLGVDYGRTVFMLWNEPHEWEGDAAKRALTTATLAAMRRRDEQRPQMSLLLINLGVGWPGNHDTDTVKDTPPDWTPYEPIHQEMLRRKIDFLGLHEYWMKEGPKQGFRWYAGRFLQCPWRVPIVIGEAAYSGAVGKPQGSVPTALQGWAVSGMTAEQYMAQLVAYNEICRSDARIIGWECYLIDYANREWQAKDIEPMYGLLRQNLNKFQPRKEVFAWDAAVPQPHTNANANLRAGPGTQYAKTGLLPTGTAVRINGVNPARDWYVLDSGHWIAAWLVDNGPAVAALPVVQPPALPAATPKLLRYPLDKVLVTQYYGQNPDAYAKYGYRGHNALDLSAAVGTPVKACADGIVSKVGNDADGYGLYVIVWHPALKVYVLTGHMSRQDVKAGDAVTQGQQVGLSGNTGNSTGPHVHFEVRAATDTGEYDADVTGMGYAAVDPVSLIEGLERGAALPLATRVLLPIVAA